MICRKSYAFHAATDLVRRSYSPHFAGGWQSEPEQEYVLAESLFLSVRCT